MNKHSTIAATGLISIILLFIIFQGPVSILFQPGTLPAPPTDKMRSSSVMRFERNDGQTDPQFDFILRGRDHHLLLSPASVHLNLLCSDPHTSEHVSSFRMQLINANPFAEGQGLDELITKSNYFIGNDPEAWKKDIPNYARVRYENIYPGIDLIYYNNDGNLEFDYVIAPGHDPGIIRMRFTGHDGLKHNRRGDLVISTGTTELMLKKPSVYQEINGQRHAVRGRYDVKKDDRIGFVLGSYDENLPLIIDPILMYATYLGGSGTDIAYGIAADASGCAYVTGSTLSLDFHTSPGAFQPDKAPGPSFLTDVFVTKFAKDGKTVLYSTYLGGRGEDRGNGIAVDNDGNAYITGMTYSHDETGTPEIESFPLKNEYQGDPGSIYEEDVFFTKLNAAGNGLLYSTYLAGDGEDDGQDIAIDSYGNAYITGINFSFDYPIRNAYMPDKPSYYYDGFVTKIDPSFSGDASLVYSTYLGGEANDDYAYGIAVDLYGHAYVTGTTESTDFPTQGPYQAAKNGSNDDAFVTKLAADGASLVWSTYLGGTGQEWGYAIAVNASGNAYVTGNTSSSTNFPVTPGAVYESTFYPYFVTKFNASGTTLEYSTFSPVGNDIALDDDGYTYVIGNTVSNTLSLENAFQHTLNGTSDAFIIRFKPGATEVPFATYLGGSDSENGNSIAVLDSNNIFVAGLTSSEDFPATEEVYQANKAGGYDAFVAKIGLPKEEFVVEVWQDALGGDAAKIPETAFDIYFVDLNDPDDPFLYLETRSTDVNGYLHLPASMYEPGWPFLLWKIVETKEAVKADHESVNDIGYDVYVDNLYIDETGYITPAYLTSNVQDTTITTIGHTWIGFNLVVSLEWAASDDYVDGLEAWLKNTSRFLYDVTNGHACLQDVAVFDDAENWIRSDIRINASNLRWPKGWAGGFNKPYGSVYYPPKHFGARIYNIDDIYRTPIVLDTYTNYSTMAHELGHYLFGFRDEYCDLENKKLKDATNFGFMDDQYRSSDPFSSEMSAFESDEYKMTAQYVEHGATCWDLFHDGFSKMYGAIRAEIHTPAAIGLSDGEYVAGPSEADLGVNAVFNFIDQTGPDAGERFDYLVKNKDGDPIPGAYVKIEKDADEREINQGKTVLEGEHRGRIRLFGAEPGDYLFFSHTKDDDDYQFLEILAQSSGKKRPDYAAVTDATVVVLNTLQGNFTMISSVGFDPAGNLDYETTADPSFSNNPTLEITDESGALDDVILAGSIGIYTTDLPAISGSEADLIFRAPDSSGTIFFVPQDLDLIDIDTTISHLALPKNALEMWPDSISTDLERLAVLGSNFPCPKTGLPDSVRRVSPVFSINLSPPTAYFESILRVFYRADTLSASVPEAVTIYTWDNGWQPMTSDADTSLYHVTTRIEEPGIYAAFLDLTKSFVTGIYDEQSGSLPEGYGLHQNYPNPFNPQTTIMYDVPVQARVKLEIFDIMGRRVRTLVDHLQTAGTHSAVWDGRDETGSTMPSGMYLCRFQAGKFNKTIRLLMMK